MKNLGNISNPKDLVTKEYVDNKKKVIVSETPPEDTSAIWVKPSDYLLNNEEIVNLNKIVKEEMAKIPTPTLDLEPSNVITSTGRPDKIETIEESKRDKVNKAPNGTIFTSTDGASVNAWQWQRIDGKWIVSLGDTGWRLHTGNVNSYIAVRRTQSNLFIKFHNWSIPSNRSGGAVFRPNEIGYRIDTLATNAGYVNLVITGEGKIAGRLTAWDGTIQYWASDHSVTGRYTLLLTLSPRENDVWVDTLVGSKL